MKTPFLLILVLYFTAAHVTAQHPLVGTWEMISVKGVDAEGDPFFLDTSSVRETKIITPTHYMLIAWDVDKDSLIFNRTMGGQVRLEGERYIETPTQASVQIFENVKVEFVWKLDGDIFTQSGTIVRPDGKEIILEALMFRRVTGKAYPENPALGTWNQLSGYSQSRDGKKKTLFTPNDSRRLIVTPTHWMRMDLKNKKFDGVLYGTYALEDKTVTTKLDYSSYPFKKGSESQLTQKINGRRIEITYSGVAADGTAATFHDIYEKE